MAPLTKVNSYGSSAARVVFVVALVSICLFLSAGAANKRHNIARGNRTGTDRLLFHNRTYTGARPRVQKIISCFPNKTSGSRVRITAFNVTDLVPRGKGGFVSVTKGGVNKSSVCFKFETQKKYGFDFNVNIWGYN